MPLVPKEKTIGIPVCVFLNRKTQTLEVSYNIPWVIISKMTDHGMIFNTFHYTCFKRNKGEETNFNIKLIGS